MFCNKIGLPVELGLCIFRSCSNPHAQIRETSNSYEDTPVCSHPACEMDKAIVCISFKTR